MVGSAVYRMANSIRGLSDMEEIPQEAKDTFHKAYGEAMAAWATLERELGTLFAFVSGIQTDMATRVYYSAHSFSSRIGMFQSALVASKITDKAKEIVRLIINKARLYSEIRNKLAHDLPSYDGDPKSATFGQALLFDAKSQFQSDEVKELAKSHALTLDDIAWIASNFDKLARITCWCWGDIVVTREPSLRRYPELLAQLPNRLHPRDRTQQTSMTQ